MVTAAWGLAGAYILVSAKLIGQLIGDTRGWKEDNFWLFGGDVDAATKISTLLARWDTGFYHTIAAQGYSPDGMERAFFPMYPSIVRWFADWGHLSLFDAALIVSATAYLGAGLILYQLVLPESGRTSAFASVISLYFFPTAFFGFAFYAESLLLLLSLASFFMARQGSFVSAGVMIALAGATRPTGWLLAIPVAVEFLRQRDHSWRRWIAGVLGAAIAPIGILATFMWVIPFQNTSWAVWRPYFALVDQEWHHYQTWPWITVIDSVKAVVFGADINPDWFSRAACTFDLACAILLLAAAAGAIGRLSPSHTAFLWASTLSLYTVHGPHGYAFNSMPRHVLAVYPLYIVLGAVLFKQSKRSWLIWLVISAALLALLSGWFSSGRWVA